MKIIIAGGQKGDTIRIVYAEKLNAISSDYDLMTLRAAPNDIMALKDAGVEDTDLFIAVTRDENININCCVIAHAMGARKTVAQIDHYDYIRPEYEAIIHKMGIDTQAVLKAAGTIFPNAKLVGVDENELGTPTLGCALWNTCDACHQTTRIVRDTQPTTQTPLRS